MEDLPQNPFEGEEELALDQPQGDYSYSTPNPEEPNLLQLKRVGVFGDKDEPFRYGGSTRLPDGNISPENFGRIKESFVESGAVKIGQAVRMINPKTKKMVPVIIRDTKPDSDPGAAIDVAPHVALELGGIGDLVMDPRPVRGYPIAPISKVRALGNLTDREARMGAGLGSITDREAAMKAGLGSVTDKEARARMGRPAPTEYTEGDELSPEEDMGPKLANLQVPQEGGPSGAPIAESGPLRNASAIDSESPGPPADAPGQTGIKISDDGLRATLPDGTTYYSPGGGAPPDMKTTVRNGVAYTYGVDKKAGRWELLHATELNAKKKNAKDDIVMIGKSPYRFNDKNELEPVPITGEQLDKADRASIYTGSKEATMRDVLDKLDARTDNDTVGWWGALGSWIPESKAYDFAVLLNTLQSSTAFRELNEMRAASETGGAIGQVSDKEQEMLKQAIGPLRQGMSEKGFKEGIQMIKDSLARWDAAKEEFGIKSFDFSKIKPEKKTPLGETGPTGTPKPQMILPSTGKAIESGKIVFDKMTGAKRGVKDGKFVVITQQEDGTYKDAEGNTYR